MSKPISIPSEALVALKKSGISDITVMICIDKNGKIHQLKGEGVTDNKQAPVDPITTAATGIQTISLIQHLDHSNSANTSATTIAAVAAAKNCITVVIGGVSVTYCK